MTLYDQYQLERYTPEYQEVFTKPNPLVSVVISTYNAHDMLIDHCLKSMFNQTYKNLEIIIIDDGSSDDTEEKVKAINDSRIIYEKIQRDKSKDTWFTCGGATSNYGLDLCTGDFIACCDDDDYFLPKKIEKLVFMSQTTKADATHHPFVIHRNPPGTVINIDSNHFAAGFVCTSMMFHHSWFKRIKIDLEMEQQGDWQKCRQIMELGANIVRHPEVLTILNQKYCWDGNSRCQIPEGWVQELI